MNAIKLLKPEDFTPIDEKKVKEHWDKIMNVPNDKWNELGVASSLEIINNNGFPYTFRTVTLNMLPYLAIEILKSINEKI